MVVGRFQHRNTLSVVAVVIIASICLALIAEGVVRARSYMRHGYSSPRIESMYQTHPATGLRIPVAGAHMGGIEINSLGFRGDEIDNPKPRGRVRLAFVGGSTTFCAEVSDNRVAWPHLVTQLLNDQFGHKEFDYVNAAVPGYTVAASRARFTKEVASLEPDIVIIYHSSNDLAKNSARQAERQGITLDRGDATLSYPASLSMLWYLIEKNLRVWQTQRRASDPAGKLDVPLGTLADPFAEDLNALVEEAKSIADTVVLVTFTTRMRRGQSEQELKKAAITSLYYMPYMTPDQLLSAFQAYNSVIHAVAKDSGAFLINDEAGIPADEAHFVDSIHFTDRGSQSVAERVYRGLLDSGALARHL